MTGSVDLTADGATLLIRFPYREDLKDRVKAIPGRRWDRAAKAWRVPATQVALVAETFMTYGFALAPEVTSLLAGTQGSASEPKTTLFDDPPSKAEPAALSIRALNERVRSGLQTMFRDPVWVVGEVLDYDKGKGRRHAFFCLVEKRDGDDTPLARAEVALFAGTAERLRQVLHDGEGGLVLRDGIEIRVLVRVDLYPPTGRFRLVIEDLDPTFTLGQMALTRETILAELRSAGLERRNAERPMPVPPLRVGVLTSAESDGWNDLLRQLETSGIGFAVTCFDVRVQGPELRPTMLAGLRWFAARHERFDVLCIVRGGGSRSDLAWFDDREVAFAVARHPLKVLCGIGHERDRSVLDAIAHCEKTPTAVGGHLVDHVRAAQEALEGQTRRLQAAGHTGCWRASSRLTDSAHRLRRLVDGRLGVARHGLREAGRRATRAAGVLLRGSRRDLDGALPRLTRGAAVAFERASSRLERQTDRQRLLDPRRVIERGFTLVRDGAGGIVCDAASLRAGQPLDVVFRDGRARATTDHVELETDERHPGR